MWESLCQILGVRELISDPRFRTIPDRVENKEFLKPILEAKLNQKYSDVWIEALNKGGIACGPINTVEQVFQDSQVLHQKMLLEVEHSFAGKIKLIGFPVNLSETPCRVALPPPTLGQHTKEILGELEYSEQDIKELKQKGIV